MKPGTLWIHLPDDSLWRFNRVYDGCAELLAMNGQTLRVLPLDVFKAFYSRAPVMRQPDSVH